MGAWRATWWKDWNLSRKFLFLSGAVVLSTLVGFAAIDYLHEQQLLTGVHELLVGRSSPDGAASLAHDHAAFLAQTKQAANELFVIHFVHLTVTLLVLFVALNLAFDRIVLLRVRNLVAATNVMAHGTWDQQVQLQGQDELGQLTAAFNKLGEVLARRVADWRNAERFSALAGLSHWTSRELSAIEGELAAQLSALANEQQPLKGCREINKEKLRAQVVRLRQIRERLDSEFYGAFHEIRLASVNAELPHRTAVPEEGQIDCKQVHSGGSHDRN